MDGKDKCQEKIVKVLGMIWSVDDDRISLCDLKKTIETYNLTKRLMLQQIALIFDPLGLFVPVIIRFKIIIQDVWKEKTDWDEKVSENVSRKWDKIKKDLSVLSSIKIKRCINCLYDNSHYELITFTDASKRAYAVAVYLRIITGNDIQVNLVYAKARLAPIKGVSIPRLELLGVLIGCRVSAFVVEQLDIPNITQILLTD